MILFRLRPHLVAALGAAALALGACTTTNPFQTAEPAAAPQPALAPDIPATIRAEELVGRWGLASFHKPEDRARIEVAARGQCGHPYVIGRGPTGGVMMHLADQAQPEELRLKGGPGGKNYIGPAGEPAGSERDREVLSFDGRVLIARYLDPDAASRYGTMVYVRCGAEGVTKRR